MTVFGYRPQLITNIDDGYKYLTNERGAITDKQTVNEDGTFGSIEPYDHEMRIMISGVNGPLTDFQNRWQILADQIFQNLMNDAGVNFVTQLTVVPV